MLCVAPVPENFTVPLLWAKLPLEKVKSSLSSNVDDVDVKVVPATVKAPETRMSAVPPENVPPEKVAALFNVMVLAPCEIVPVYPDATCKLAAVKFAST